MVDSSSRAGSVFSLSYDRPFSRLRVESSRKKFCIVNWTAVANNLTTIAGNIFILLFEYPFYSLSEYFEFTRTNKTCYKD